MRVLEGKLVDSGIKVGIVAARFNEFIVSKLVAGAKDGLVRHDVSEENIDLAWVPGAFEIPLIASKMAKSGKYDAVICLGAVIRGATSHYDYVCSEVSKGIANVSLFMLCLECLLQIQSSRQLSVPEQRQAIRDLSALKVLLRWLILLKRLKDNI